VSVLVWIERDDDGTPATTARRTLTAARAVAYAAGRELEGVALGADDEELAALAREQGVARLHVVTHELLDGFAPEAWAEALVQLVRARRPAAMVAGATSRGTEVAAHVAARLDLPLAANCLEVRPAGDGAWELTRQRWGGVLLEDARLEAEVALLTVVPHVVDPEPAGAPGAAEVVPFLPTLGEELTVARVRERTTVAAGVSLATAPVVVAGGRGVGSAEGFGPLEELAALLGGAVGCSRVATNNGWRSHNDQVGQTGTRVAPEVYLALGISGATQHWVGCMNAKTIVAVNTDADAPMVTRAHYAVVGDLHTFLPALLAEVRNRKPVTV
jgi:electron transfer flavoprotein alpha subunit